jgi:uncharacterized membrane protein
VAQRTVVEVTDDLDGSDGAETITFAFDGKTMEIDLSKKNADKFRKAIQPFMDAARKSGGPSRSTRRSSSTSSSSNSADTAAVRAWAASNGIEVNSRGRVSAKVLEQYRAAGN